MPKNLMTGQVLMNFRVPTLEFFGKLVTFFILIKYYTFFVKIAINRAKFTSQNLMPRQNLTPEIPNARSAHPYLPLLPVESRLFCIDLQENFP